jgi:alkylation response protein AidB-like acyl-CoA dehydrogenase
MAVTEPGLGAKGGITCFIIDMGTPGLKIERIMNTVGIDRPCVLSMKDVRVHESQIMGKIGFGFDTVIKFMNQGRFKIAASCVGKAQYLVDLTLKRAKERVAFGRPIGDYQAIQQHLVDSVVELRMCRFLLYECADAADRGDNERQAAAIAKYACAEMLGRVADRAVGVYGGNGLLTEYGIERFYRDARGARIYEGTTEILRGVIAKSLGFANT